MRQEKQIKNPDAGQEKQQNRSDILQDRMIQTARQLIKFPSVKAEGSPGMPFGKGIADCLEYVLELCGSFGFHTKNCGGYAGYAEAGAGEEMLGILMHLDVVPAGGDWTYPPFAGEIRDGRLYGRGAIDDKGPAAAAIYALKTVIDSGAPLKRRVRLIFGTDEENDWEDMAYYVKSEELPAFGFTPDGDFPLIYAEKGILEFDLTAAEETEKRGSLIKGGEAYNVVPDFCRAAIALQNGETVEIEEKGISAHASTPEAGENAISKVMERLYERKKGGDLACSEAMTRFIDFYHDKIGFCLHGEKIGCGVQDETTGKLTMNAGMIKASDERITLSMDLRCPVSFTSEEILGRLNREVREYGLSIENVDFLKPVFIDRDSDLIKKLLKVYRNATGDESEPAAMGGGTYARAMDNIVAFGPLFPGREAMEHRKDEYIILEDLLKLKEIYTEAIKEFTV
jgi:succinyl-diaminopimelate desuccinylase